MNYLYHGSFIKGINTLLTNAKLHNSEEKVVYLTSNYVYALLYVWDQTKNKRKNKYVTGYIKNGIVYYEEQFPYQLYTFYKGVKGYIYYTEMKTESNDFIKGTEESFYYSKKDVNITKYDYIDDVYNKIMEYANKGLIKILYYEEYSEQKKQELIDKTLYTIIKKNLLKETSENALFFKQHFKESWEKAEKCQKTKLVTICGSLKFYDKMKEIKEKLTLENKYIVLIPLNICNNDLTRERIIELMELQRRKIEISDIIYIINVNGYIGEATKSEINYAKELRKEINYLEDNFN